MSEKMTEKRREAIYPVEPWSITEENFDVNTNYRNETTFALSNGYIGTRGTFEESYEFDVDEGLEGNFVNGFYESEDIRYGEWNFGFPTKSQSLLNVPNGKGTHIYLDGEMFDMNTGTVNYYERKLSMEQGLVTRQVSWTSPSGKTARFLFERMVSFANKHVIAQRIKIVPETNIKEVKFRSFLDAEVENHTRKTNPLVDYGPFGKRIFSNTCFAEETLLYFEGQTKQSGLELGCGVCHAMNQNPQRQNGQASEYLAEAEFSFEATIQEEIVFDKFIIYTTSLDREVQQLSRFVKETAKMCQMQGYEILRKEQVQYMAHFWRHADVEIRGDEALQQGIRFNLFHTMQACGRDGKTGMGAKGLSGEGYEGHYFWDTEMYVLPVFIYTAPEIARSLLEYRYNTLDQARDRAKVLGHPKGALYPWRTINGEEASTYFPLGTAQYHINADIAYAFKLYVDVTGDTQFYQDMAAEVLCETARIWADVGWFAENRGNTYCICAVTGPDEYNAIVDNNFYTNLMARENIRAALECLEDLKQMGEELYLAFVQKLQITENETAYWKRIVENMYFPYDENRQVYALDDRFMMLKPWHDSKIPEEKRHLLYENYHPLFVYRQRMSKQADAILGMYLHSHLFTKEELKRNYDFYQEVTLHHSSLSTCIFGILACEIDDYEQAYTYFAQSARMDLDDYHNNFYAGIHAANMAGTWQAIVNGFAGVRCQSNQLKFRPYLPKSWEGYAFKLTYQNCILAVDIQKSEARFTLLEGQRVEFFIGEKKICIEKKGERYVEKI